MANNINYSTPFNVQLSGKATAFHCPESKLSVHSKQIATVHKMTDTIRQWLMAGGLEVTEEKATVGVVAAVAAAPKASDKPGASKPKAPVAGASKGKSAAGAPPAKVEEDEAEPEEAEKSADDILAETE